MTIAEKHDILHIQILWEESIRCLDLGYRVEVSPEMATRWVSCYGMEVIEYTLPITVASWKRKWQRDGADFEEFEYLRNYCQACMRDNRDAGRFKISKEKARVPDLSTTREISKRIQ